MENQKTNTVYFYPENPTDDDQLNAEVELGHILTRDYGFDRDTVLNDYEVVAESMGFSGNPVRDLEDFRNREKELGARATRVLKKFDQGPVEKYARAFASGTSQVGYNILAGLLDLSSKLPEKKDSVDGGRCRASQRPSVGLARPAQRHTGSILGSVRRFPAR